LKWYQTPRDTCDMREVYESVCQWKLHFCVD